MSFKELAIALKEAKAGGAYVEGGTSLQTLLTQLSLRMQDQGHNFKKVSLGTMDDNSAESGCPDSFTAIVKVNITSAYIETFIAKPHYETSQSSRPLHVRLLLFI